MVDAHFFDCGARESAIDDRDVYTSFFKYFTVLKYARDAVTASRTIPCVRAELRAVNFLKCGHNFTLLRLDEFLHAETHRRGESYA